MCGESVSRQVWVTRRFQAFTVGQFAIGDSTDGLHGEPNNIRWFENRNNRVAGERRSNLVRSTEAVAEPNCRLRMNLGLEIFGRVSRVNACRFFRRGATRIRHRQIQVFLRDFHLFGSNFDDMGIAANSGRRPVQNSAYFWLQS